MTQFKKITKFCFFVAILAMTPMHTVFANDKLIQIINSQTKQIKELSRKVDSLESNITRLKSEMSQLRSDSRIMRDQVRKAAQMRENEYRVNKSNHLSEQSHIPASSPSMPASSVPISSVVAAEIINPGTPPAVKSFNAPDVIPEQQAALVEVTSAERAHEQRMQEEARRISDENTEILGRKMAVRIPQTVVNPGKAPTEENESISGKAVNIAEDKRAYDAALMLMKDGRLSDAEQGFSDFIRDYPNSSLRDKASFWYAESFYRQGVYNRAAAEYLNSYKAYPKGSKAPDALLKLSYSLNALNKRQEACNMLEKLDKEFPNLPNNLVIRSEDAKSRMKCNKYI